MATSGVAATTRSVWHRRNAPSEPHRSGDSLGRWPMPGAFLVLALPAAIPRKLHCDLRPVVAPRDAASPWACKKRCGSRDLQHGVGRLLSPVSGVVAVSACLALATAPVAAVAAVTIPMGHYEGRTSQQTVIAFDYTRKKAIIPTIALQPAVYNLATRVTFRCNTGGDLHRRIIDPLEITSANGVFVSDGNGTTPTPGEYEWSSFRTHLRPGGHASGAFHVKIAHVSGSPGRTCSSGTITWNATLRR
jgi:hypothetical protein